MNRHLRREIAACLRVAGSVDRHLAVLRRFTRRDWESVTDWLHLSGIALIFWNRLQALGVPDAVPPKVAAGLEASLNQHRHRVRAMAGEFDLLNREFEQAGVEYAALKGFALIPDYCPDASLRPSYDYDYLVSHGTHVRAQETLLAAGYVLKRDQGDAHHMTFARTVPPSSSWQMPDGLYAATFPRKVELHQSLWVDQAFQIPLSVPQDSLRRKRRRNWQGLSFCCLGEEDALLFQTLHAFQHILHNWCRLGWLWEIAYFLERRSNDEPFWTRFFARLEGDQRLMEIVTLLFSLASSLFNAPLPAGFDDTFRTAMRNQVSLWADRYGHSSALDNFSENKFTLFLYREFVPDEAAWRKIRTSRLLPAHRPNRAAAIAGSSGLSAIWKQGRYVAQRLIHHSAGGVRYALEAVRWERIGHSVRPQPKHRAAPM